MPKLNQAATKPADDSRELIFGICDRLFDHGHCVTDVVMVPANADGAPDWDIASPANVEALPDDEWPEDPILAERAAVIVDHIDGCDKTTSMLVFLREDGNPTVEQIAGPAHDADIAMRIIGRDIGAKPPAIPPSSLREASEKLLEEIQKPPAAANDNKPDLNTFPVVNPAEWHGQPIPARQWFIPDLVPMRQVTLLSGDGGVGKSLFALQLAAAAAMSVETLELEPWAGRTLYVGAEDEAEEFQRRLDDIARAHGNDLSNLTRLRLIPLADRDALLSVPDKAGNMQPSPLWRGIVKYATEYKPRLMVLDTSADLFGGDEIKRGQVRQFIAMLRKLAIEIDCAIVLLSHPSVAGMQTGTGISGSTGWNNSVRSRLYLTKEKDEDSDVRILRVMKSNYGETGREIRLRWKAGAFVLDDGRPTAGSMLVAAKADRVFRELLTSINDSGLRVSAAKSSTYAPSVMADMPSASGFKKRQLEEAMRRLMAAGEVKVEMEGPPSKPRQRLVVVCSD